MKEFAHDAGDEWNDTTFINAILGLLPSGFFKSGAYYEEAYQALMSLVIMHEKDLMDISKKMQPDNIFLG